MTELPRGVDERITWFHANPTGGPGWCARHCWRALGGDQGNPPAWGARNANEVYDKVRATGRYWTSTPIPRGALILWRYGTAGHAAFSAGDNRIHTTDPAGKPGSTGIEALDYPQRAWGASPIRRIWTDTYNGARFDIEEPAMATGNYDFHYGGKPEDVQTVGRKYVRLDASRWDPARRGLEHTLVYINVAPTFASGKTRGSLRLRLVRADGDASSYHDYVIDADALAAGRQLITHTYWEAGDGKPSHIEVRCQGGLQSAVLGTRYTKRAVIVD